MFQLQKRKRLKTSKKNITYLLFGIFLFPIVYQSIHLTRHASHTTKLELHACPASSLANPVPQNAEQLSSHQPACIICDYHFCVNAIPGLSILRTTVPALLTRLMPFVARQYIIESFLIASPRAPPSCTP